MVNIAATIGGRLPAYVTSMGRVLLAAQDDAALDAYLARISPEKLNARR
ncbi:MAG: IclR family transcriptional regulator C-terminal domain-containing protein [Geminicoccaceae bacterium]